MSDIEIARNATMKTICDIARSVGLQEEEWENYGKYKAKIELSVLERLADRPEGKLVLVTAMNPTTAGEGKTTVSVGLAQALNQIGRNSVQVIGYLPIISRNVRIPKV